MIIFMYRSVPYAPYSLLLITNKLTIYAPMIYMALSVMIFDAGRSITWASGRGLGPGNLEFFGPKMALAYRVDAISQGPIPPTCPRNVSARIKNITHVAI
jgi:hypothetical protein